MAYGNSPGFVSAPRQVKVDPANRLTINVNMKVSTEDTGGSPPSRPWRGRIIDREGRPVKETLVRFRGRGGPYTDRTQVFALETQTDSDGKFCLRQATGERGELLFVHRAYRDQNLRVRFDEPERPAYRSPVKTPLGTNLGYTFDCPPGVNSSAHLLPVFIEAHKFDLRAFLPRQPQPLIPRNVQREVGNRSGCGGYAPDWLNGLQTRCYVPLASTYRPGSPPIVSMSGNR